MHPIGWILLLATACASPSAPPTTPPVAARVTVDAGVDAGVQTQTTILIVDEAEILEELEPHLVGLGFKVLTATDGNRALEVARSEHPDVVVLEVLLPQKSGWEVARTLKKDPTTERIKIIVASKIGATINEAAGNLYEVDGRLDKPYELQELSRLIDQVLGR